MSALRRTWRDYLAVSHDCPFFKVFPGRRKIVLELHRAPSDYHLEGRAGRFLWEWLERQSAGLPWTPAFRPEVTSLPGLSPAGCFVYLSINLFKDGRPRIRDINDLALLLARHGDRIDWGEVGAAGRKAGLAPALDAALRLVREWRGVAPAGFRSGSLPSLRRLFAPYLSVPAVVRGVPDRDSGIELAWPAALFGLGAARAKWLRYERDRMRRHARGPLRRLLYVVLRPFELAWKLSRFARG